MEKKPIVHLRVYKGELNYTSDGKIKNENQSVKIQHNTVEWFNFMKYLNANQYSKVGVDRVLNGSTMEPLKDYKEIEEEVKKAFEGQDKEIQLTPDQKRIAELEAKIEGLMKASKPVKSDVVVPKEDNELQEARKEYQKVFGKKGHHSWTVDQLKEKIAEK